MLTLVSKNFRINLPIPKSMHPIANNTAPAPRQSSKT